MRTPKPTFIFLIIACLCVCGDAARAGVGFSFSLLDQNTPIQYRYKQRHGLSAFQDRPLINLTTSGRMFAVEYDSTYSTVYYSLRSNEINLIQPTNSSLETYRDMRYSYDLRELRREESIKHFKTAGRDRSGEGIAIDVPFRIKSKTFRRIFGGDNIGLRVQGNITINGNIRRQKFDELQAANQRNTNTSFQIDMIQQFSITGKVGEKVEVKIDQDSERLFDFENSLKLTYTGNPDEIIQKVEAGNVNLNLGTRLATFSGRNTGLFGLKTEAKVGALKLTGIASLERGQKNRQSPNQDVQRYSFSEKEIIRDQYFWLTDTSITVAGGTLTTADYRENYRNFSSNRQHVGVAPQFQIADIEVFVSIQSSLPENTTEMDGRAVAIQYYDSLNLPEGQFPSTQDGFASARWKRLNRTEYEWEAQLGFIRLTTPLQQGQHLGVAFSTFGLDGIAATADDDTFGTLPGTVDSLSLILLRSDNPLPTDITWNLMFRHVYSLRATNLDPLNFKLTIRREASASTVEETGPPDGTGRSYLEFFDFDREGPSGEAGADGLVDNQFSIIRWDLGELHFLDLTPFNPSGYFENGNFIQWPLADLATEQDTITNFIVPALYEQPASVANSGGRKWLFTTEYKGTASVFDLGVLVLEGSEEVTLNGQPLQRGVDYSIDYLSGTLRILNEAAKAPGANLEITYESGQVFQLDKKTLLGARAEYELWRDSYIGGMVLHLNEKTLDRRVRLGNEPLRNTLYDVNSSLKFTPNFLSAAVDRLPLITTNAPSEFTIDGEMAKVYPNPNSLSNDATGDQNGLAYIDDFEGSRRASPLGLLRRMWTPASIPLDVGVDSLRGRFRWWNPAPEQQVPVQDVFPDREINSQVADRLQSIVMEFVPDQSTGNPERSWGGIMRYLGEGYADQTRSQFIEFWVQLPPAAQLEGRLVIDIGEVSEDVIPNGQMDSEDRAEPGEQVTNLRREYGNGVLSPEEDTGIDGIFAPDPLDSAFWNGVNNPPVPSWDDWQFTVGSNDYFQINGTENSRNDEGGTFPDSEDLNNSNFLDLANDYFSYSIELDYDSPFIVGGQDNQRRWRLFRIPLNIDDPNVRREVGAPDMTSIRWARIFMTGITDSLHLEFVQMDIVGNEWLPEFTSADSTEYVSVAVINNHENPGYTSPPGVEGEIDPITNLRQREQSLVLKINALESDSIAGPVPQEFFVAKNLYQQISLIEYKRLKMFVHGGGIDVAQFRDEKYQLMLRLGQTYGSLASNYYEIVQTIKPGWDRDNIIDVALNDLSLMHARRSEYINEQYPDSLPPGISEVMRFALATDSTQPGDSLVINGRPSLQNIGVIALGVRLIGSKNLFGSNDEIWVDELRVSDIYKDPGTAAEVSSQLRIADFATVSGGYSTLDADFHNVNTRIGSQESRETIRGNLNVSLQKIGLDRYGVQLPATVQYSETNGIPKYIPNTDARTPLANPPDSIKTLSKTITYTANFSKGGNSPNPWVRWTLEHLRLAWDSSVNEQKSYQIIYARREQSGVRADYSFPTARGRGIAPLFWSSGVPVISLLGSPKFYYKPTVLGIGIAGDRLNDFRHTRQGQITNPITFGSSVNGAIGFQPVEPLETDLSRTHSHIRVNGTWAEFLSGEVGRLTSVQQSWSNRYSPRFAAWLQPNFTYNATYNWSHTNLNQENGEQIANNRTMGVDVALDFRQIFGGSDSGRGRGRGLPEPRRPKPEEGDAPQDTTGAAPDTTAPKPPSPSLGQRLASVLSPVKKALLVLDPVQLRYDVTRRHSASATRGQADPAYQFGFTQDPGVDTVGGYTSIPLFGETEDFSARSGIRLTQDIRTTFNYNLRTAENRQQQTTGTREETSFWIGKKTGAPTSFPFVDVSLDWSGLEKIAFVGSATNSVSLSSALANRMREAWQNNPGNVQSREFTRQWNPLVGVNVSWKNGIESQIRLNQTQSFTDALQSGTKSRQNGREITATISYTIRTGFRLPLLWMSSIRLENQTTLSLNVDYSTDKQEQTSTRDSDEYAVRAQDTQWSIQPRLTYSFSSTVQGQGYVTVQRTTNQLTDKSTQLFEFGIQVQIAIRG